MSEISTVPVPEHWMTFIETQIAAGRYASSRDVVQVALRLLEERDAQLGQLRDALIEGEKSGSARPFDNQAFLARMHAERRARP